MGEGRQVEIDAGEDPEHARRLLGLVDVVRKDPPVRVLAANEVHPGCVDRDVFDVGTAHREHPRVLDPLNPISENAPHR